MVAVNDERAQLLPLLQAKALRVVDGGEQLVPQLVLAAVLWNEQGVEARVAGREAICTGYNRRTACTLRWQQVACATRLTHETRFSLHGTHLCLGLPSGSGAAACPAPRWERGRIQS